MTNLIKNINILHKLSESNIIDLTNVDNFSYSAIMRELNKQCSIDQTKKFMQLYHNFFNECIKNKNCNSIALQNSLIEFSKIYKIKISSKLLKTADIVSNQRMLSDESGYLDTADRKSFFPASPTVQIDPYDVVYNEYLDSDDFKIKQENGESSLPINGFRENIEDISGMSLLLKSYKNMNYKKAYNFTMSYDVSDFEKKQAKKAIVYFDQVSKEIYKCTDYLNLLYTPFSESIEIPKDQILQIRTKLREFRNNTLEKFNMLKKISLQCINEMKIFNNDTQINKLMTVFITNVENVEESVDEFAKLFSNLESKDFVPNITKSIEIIKNNCDQLDTLIYDRIISDIKDNILTSNWTTNIK